MNTSYGEADLLFHKERHEVSTVGIDHYKSEK